MLLSLLFNVFFLTITSVESTQCPKFGQVGYTCGAYDYCNTTAGLVCGNGLCGTSVCPANWLKWNNTFCFFLYDNGNSLVTYDVALQICRNNSAELITVDTVEKFNIFKNISISYSYKEVWVCTRTSSSSSSRHLTVTILKTGVYLDYLYKYKFPDGSNLTTGTALWNSGEPNYPNSERCVKGGYSGSFGFSDVPCFWSFAPLCEMRTTKCVNSVCQCRKGLFFNTTINRCIPVKTFNAVCTLNEHCESYSGLICTSGLCKCVAGYTWNSGEGACRQ